jgi:hypothetical protein
MLPPAIILSTLTLAHVCHTIGRRSKRVQKVLEPWHAAFFGLGLSADANGICLMSLIADQNRAVGAEPGILNPMMAVTGANCDRASDYALGVGRSGAGSRPRGSTPPLSPVLRGGVGRLASAPPD